MKNHELMDDSTIVLGFSGGLDTSFFVPYLKERFGCRIVTVTVNTGGFSAAEMDAIRRRSEEVGADAHVGIDAREEFFSDVVCYIIKTNSLRWEKYPLCVAAERITQVKHLGDVARKENTKAIGHGSTGAGNDQFRFDSYILALMPDAHIVAPVREQGFSRSYEAKFLKQRGIVVQEKTRQYSYNVGLLGTSIGGKETTTLWDDLPEAAYLHTTNPVHAPDTPEVIELGFDHGVLTSLGGTKFPPIDIWSMVDTIACHHGVGRDIYIGDTTVGSKGRIGFEAPAATVVFAAHKALEAATLSKLQYDLSRVLSQMYSDVIYHARYFDSVRRNIETAVDDIQNVVSGVVRLSCYKGHVRVLGVKSATALWGSQVTYGENNTFLDGKQAEGACRLHALSGMLCHMRDGAE